MRERERPWIDHRERDEEEERLIDNEREMKKER